MTPKSNNGGPHEKPTTTKSPGHAGVLQAKGNMSPACTRLAGTPLLSKVRVLKASTKNPGLTPFTPPSRTQQPESRASKQSNRNLESTKRAQNRLTPQPRASD